MGRWALLNVCTVLDETNGSSFRPVSVLAIVAICGVNQYIGDNFLSLLPSLLLALNLEKKKKSTEVNMPLSKEAITGTLIYIHSLKHSAGETS